MIFLLLLAGGGFAQEASPIAPPTDAATVTDEQRSALTVTAYALELHLVPARAGLSGVARLTVRNDGRMALERVALQLSSTLRWDAVSGRLGVALPAKLHLDQHRVDTDADHTGAANEAVVQLPGPLAAGASMELTALYSGTIERSGARRTRAGEAIDEAGAADWDEIAPGGTALRGYGNVLWYPVASPQVFLEEGAQLAAAIAEQRRRQQGATVRLRLEVESGPGSEDAAAAEASPTSSSSTSSSSSRTQSGTSSSSTGSSGGGVSSSNPAGASDAAAASAGRTGEASGAGLRRPPVSPADAFFCGRPATFSVVNEGMARGGEADETETTAIAVADWPAAPLGFGPPSLFVSASSPTGDGPVAVAGATATELAAVEAAARAAEPIIVEWLGSPRERAPVLLAHAGQPFAQRALLVEGAREAASSFAMTHLESHAYFSSPQVWLDEGVAQFLPLVAIERTAGRPAAIAQLRDLEPALSLADTGETSRGLVPSEALVDASREVFFRNKAVLVLWMLRSVAGDRALATALTGMRQLPEAERGAKSFEASLERVSGKDLGWFFRDWVFADRGLPDLSIVSATPRSTLGSKGQPSGSLVAVEVRNDGHAEAEVPVTVRSGTLTATERLRVPAMGTASVRILFQGTPEEVEVNDGTVPEVGRSEHLLVLPRPSAEP